MLAAKISGCMRAATMSARRPDNCFVERRIVDRRETDVDAVDTSGQGLRRFEVAFVRKPIARHQQHAGAESTRQAADLRRESLREALALGLPARIPDAEPEADFARHESAARVKPAAHRDADERAVGRQTERADEVGRLAVRGGREHERGIRHDLDGPGRATLKPFARELVAHRHAIQEPADHARRCAALGVIERPYAEAQARDVALNHAQREESGRPIRDLDSAVVVLEQPAAADDDQILPPCRVEQCREAGGAGRDDPRETGQPAQPAPSGNDRDLDSGLRCREALARRRENSCVPEIGVGVAAEEEDVCHKGTRAH